MDFSDIFSGDTWDAISPIIQGGAAIAGGINGMQNARNFRNAQAGTLANLDQLYSPNSPYAQNLRQTLERRDAAAGRRSQYGPRETELAAKLTQARASELMNPQYTALQRGANASPYGALAGALGYLTGGQKGQSNPLINTASRLNSLRRGYNSLSSMFGPSSTGTAADLGGAQAAMGDMLTGGSPSSLSAGGGVFGSPSELGLSPFSATNPSDAMGSLATSFGQAPWLGGVGEFGGAGGALSGMGAGSLGGTVGGADTLGSMFGGTGFLPGYTGTASGAFGGGAAGGAGAAGGSEGLGGLSGLSGFAAPLGVFGLGMALAAGGKTSPEEQMANYNTYKNGGVQSYLNANRPQMGFGSGLGAYNPWDAQGNVRPFNEYLADQQRGLSGQFNPEQVGQVNDFYNWALQNKDAITSGSQNPNYSSDLYQAGD